ncbi:MAG: hypothetical protein HOP19_11395 [Acidobacteria bacterium]|nr:hypothetical protein [Acidobacteriota bacterium]
MTGEECAASICDVVESNAVEAGGAKKQMKRFNRRYEAGWTLLDLLVIVIPTALMAAFIAGIAPKPWGKVAAWLIAPIFGVGCWCLLFLWLLPSLERRGILKTNPPDDKPDE